MLAMAFAKNGDVDVIEPMDLPVPELADDEVLVQVKACALNHLDLWMRQGLPFKIPMPHISGCDVTGVVAKLGRSVTGFREGQRVMISPAWRCGHCEWCTSGEDSMCSEFKILGLQVQGGLAEFTKARAVDLIPISEAWSFAEWAAIPLVFLTAWHMLFRRVGLKPGDDVLVQAAGSGVGSAAIQIAKLAGARVFATAGSDAKLKLAQELGADYAINYMKTNFADEVMTLTGKRGVDIVFEHIGESVWKDSMRCMARNGRLVTCGATSGPQVNFDLRFFFMRQLTVTGAYMGSRDELLQVVKLVERRALRPVVDTVMPLGETREAQRRMANREQFGKIVLQP
jgi:NADPH:quinone reductase-like Zn-dependent oxidoreductase